MAIFVIIIALITLISIEIQLRKLNKTHEKLVDLLKSRGENG